ncbi:MAG: hypothetical protein HY062_01795 [Bacteroidetes bacterium]|nr:hypothetical protein [Bacteroidota bacterium]
MENVENLPETNTGSLSKQFADEMLNPSIDLAVDYSEIYIDDLIDNAALKEIPIIKSIVGVIKGGISINQFFFAKKLLTFIKDFNSGTIDPQKKLKFKDKIQGDDKFRKKVSEQVMVFIDRFMEVKKAKIAANLFKAYVEEKITYEQFVSINISLERLHPDAYHFLGSIESLNYEINHEYEGDRNWEAEALIQASGLSTEPGDFWHGFKLKEEGKLLFEMAIKPILK